MRRRVRQVVAGAFLIALTVLGSWAYSYTSPMTPRASREWSRGRTVGRTPVNRPVALRPAPTGGMYLVWPNLEDRLELAHIGTDGEVLFRHALPVGVGSASDPQLQVADDGRLHLLWREKGEENAVIRYALLGADGKTVERLLLLSDPSLWAERAPRLVRDPRGRLHALWADRTGVQWVMLSGEGEVLQGPTLLIPEGRAPAVQVDGQGRLHLAWQKWTERNVRWIYYAVLDPGTGVLGEPEEIAQVFLRSGTRLEGPAVGLDPEMGYVLWSALDIREVSSRGRYAFFPLGLPRQKRVLDMPLVEGRDPSGIWVLEGQRRPLLVALSETVGTAWGEEVQVAVAAVVGAQIPAYETWGLAQLSPSGRRGHLHPVPAAWEAPLHQGAFSKEWEGEHIVTASNLPSVKPALTVDDNLYLHLAWLEPGGFGQYRVVYASPAPEVKRTYNALTLWDIVDPLFRGVFRLALIVLALVPMLIQWAVLPMGVLVVYHFVTGEEWLISPRSWAMLGVTLALEVALTLLLPPRRDIPWPFLRWIAPIVTAALAGGGMACFLRRHQDKSLFEAFFLFTGVHTLLQLLVYFLPWGLGGRL